MSLEVKMLLVGSKASVREQLLDCLLDLAKDLK